VTTLTDAHLDRYSRQILLPQWDVAGQLALQQASILMIGLGGLGSAAALYLAAAGVGELILCDPDHVDNSNLQRQVIHSEARVGQLKVESAAEQIQALNNSVKVTTISERLDESTLAPWVARASILLDGTDNFATRSVINRVCWQHKIPLVSAAAIRFEGQISVFDARNADSPCYHCLYGPLNEEAMTCSQSGILGPVVGIMGVYQALEALKLIAGIGEPLVGRLQVFDGLKSAWREYRIQKDPSCSVCGSGQCHPTH
jgi:molybdopterin-synthase adenylyltransferase